MVFGLRLVPPYYALLLFTCFSDAFVCPTFPIRVRKVSRVHVPELEACSRNPLPMPLLSFLLVPTLTCSSPVQDGALLTLRCGC